MGPTWGPSGPCRPQTWPHEPCYQGGGGGGGGGVIVAPDDALVPGGRGKYYADKLQQVRMCKLGVEAAQVILWSSLCVCSSQSPHRFSAGGSLLFMWCVSLTLTRLVSAWRRGAPSAILAKPLSDCVTLFCLRQFKSRRLNVCEIEKKKNIFKQIEYLAFLTEVCVVMLWVAPATRVVVVRFFFVSR